ncbi:Imm42 family immunity protein [uncultured Algibacter sp.]|uniref:Imm42 family immunity protein n=1 Tax=uncultured Algibacter sp. TaxID=298659 RepID=UPI003216F60F
MIFGDKNIFAIESDFFQGKDYLFISYCFWVDNEKVGDNNQKSLLVSELENIEHNLNTLNNRKSSKLEEYSCKEIYAYLNFELWNIGSSDIKIENIENIN